MNQKISTHKGRPTAFQERVYETVRQIPAGQVSTYSDVAKAVDCTSSRAVGQALRRNPYGADVPCHRVIASDLTLGIYDEESRHDMIRKRRLLEKEGVTFDYIGRITTGIVRQFGPSPASVPRDIDLSQL